MIGRCHRENDRKYRYYGARGIFVCERWRCSFADFLADMGERPDGTTLDRIDNDGNYEPGNCRWATVMQQARNRRRTIYATIGAETRPLSEWISALGIHRKMVESRIRKGYTAEAALTTPVAPGRARSKIRSLLPPPVGQGNASEGGAE